MLAGLLIRTLNVHIGAPVMIERLLKVILLCHAAVFALVHGIALLRAGGVNSLNELVELMVRAGFGVGRVVAEVDTALVDKRKLRVVQMRIIPLTSVTLIPNFGKLYI